jgi:hypothetical protein
MNSRLLVIERSLDSLVESLTRTLEADQGLDLELTSDLRDCLAELRDYTHLARREGRLKVVTEPVPEPQSLRAVE